MLTFLQRDVGLFGGDALVGRTYDAAALEVELLVAVGAPADDAGHGEERRVDLARDAYAVIDEARVEVDVGAKDLAFALDLVDGLDGDLLDEFHELQLLEAALLGGQFVGHLLQENGARVGLGIDGVANAVDKPGAVEGLPRQEPADAGGDLLFVLPVPDVLLHELYHVADLEVGAAVLGPLQGADARGDGREGVGAGRGGHADGEGGVVTSAVLRMEYQEQVERAGVQFRETVALEHVQEVLRQRKARLRVADVQRTAVVMVAVHVVRVGNGGGELGDEFDALAHEVVAGDVVGVLVEGVELHHAAREDVHDVVTLELDDVQDGLLLKRHVVEDQVLERLELLGVRKPSGEQQEADLLVPEALLGHDGMDEVLHLVAPEIKPALDGKDAPVVLPLVSDDVADVGEADKHARAVLVAQSPLDVEFLEELRIHAGAGLHLVRELVYQILVEVLPCHSSPIRWFVNSRVPMALPSGMRRARSAVAQPSAKERSRAS